MKRVTALALIAAALLGAVNIDGANASTIRVYYCEGKTAVWEKTESLENRITYDGKVYPISGGTDRFPNEQGQTITMQMAANDEGEGVAMGFTLDMIDRKEAYYLDGVRYHRPVFCTLTRIEHK